MTTPDFSRTHGGILLGVLIGERCASRQGFLGELIDRLALPAYLADMTPYHAVYEAARLGRTPDEISDAFCKCLQVHPRPTSNTVAT